MDYGRSEREYSVFITTQRLFYGLWIILIGDAKSRLTNGNLFWVKSYQAFTLHSTSSLGCIDSWAAFLRKMKANFITATTKRVSILILAPANNYFRDGSDIFKIKFEFLFSLFSVEDLEEELVSTEKKTFCAKCKCPKKTIMVSVQ